MANYQPAFPVTFKYLVGYDTNNQPIYSEQQDAGMTLRDYFAAQAMSFLVPLRTTHQTLWPELAASAYEMADAMIKARVQS